MRFGSVKNAALVLLSLLCLFLLLQALGAFNYTVGDFSEAYKSQAARRAAAVNNAPAWKVVITAPQESPIGRDALAGATHMVERVNNEGGVLGKPIDLLQKDSSADVLENKFVIQEICEQPDTAFLIGPWYTAEALSIRGITQFQALPALSIALGEDLPPLEPDTFVSVLPPLSFMTGPIIEELKARGCKRILLISPDKNHYGGQFASRLERDIGFSEFFEEVFRTDYTPKAEFRELFQILKLYHDNTALDAILFTGDETDLAVLGRAMRGVNIRTPVFGSDLLDVPGIRKMHAADFPAELLYPSLTLSPTSGWAYTEKAGEEGAPGLWKQYGALCVALIKEALEGEGTYDPGTAASAMREALRKSFQAENCVIRVELLGLDAPRQEAASSEKNAGDPLP